MRRTLLLAFPILIGALGCTRFAGPIETRHMDRADGLGPDGRPYSIQQQEARGRARYAIPEDNFRWGPTLGVDRIDPIHPGSLLPQ
jgi:hypothetical protein